MAITQQLARLTPEQLVSCRSATAEIDRLCSFQLLDEGDYLDLDWASAPLIEVCERAGCSPDDVASLRRGLEGGAEVNPAYRDAAGTIGEHPVTALEPEDVVTTSRALARLRPCALEAASQHAGAMAALAEVEHSRGPAGYLLEHLEALQAFYDGAAARELAVVMWWD